MSAIIDIKCVLTQKAFDAFCAKYYILEEVHPVFPNPNDTMHERLAGKIGLYTRFFDYANFRLRLSTFLVDVLRHFHMDIFAFIHAPDPTKVKVVERERNEDEPLLLETTISRTVPLLPVVPDRAKSELEASVDRLFDEGGSGNQTEQGDSVGGGKGADIQPVSEAIDTVVEDVAPLQPRRQRKRKTMVVNAGESSPPPKRLREDHGTPSGASVGGKSMSAVQRLLAGAVLNAKVRGEAIPTLPFVTSSVSATPKLEGIDHTDSVAEVDSLVRSSVPVMTAVTTVTATVDPALVVKEKPVKPSLFSADSSSAGGADPNTDVFSDLTSSDFLVGGIRTVIDPDTDLQKTYVPQWSVTNGSRLDDGRFNVGAARQMSLSAEVRMRAEYNVKERRRLKSIVEKQDELLKTSNFGAIEKSLRDETNALRERNVILEKERNALDVKVTELEASAASKGRELTDLNAQLTSVKSQNDNLVDRVHELEVSSVGLHEKVTVYENCTEQLEKFQDDQMKVINDKFDKLWLLTQGMKLAIIKCLHSPKYLSALGKTIDKAIEKGMQDGLSAGITHGKEGRVLTAVAAHNPSAEVDYIAALQRLQNVNFLLLAELRSSKDASIEAMMNILCLEEPLAYKFGLNELQPYVDQLMVPVHHSSDKVVIGATTLSLALDVSSIRVQKIRENIANQRSALRDVFVPLAGPFSVAALIGTEGTSDTVVATADTFIALSTTFASVGTIAPSL
ncbi:hypothetical protein Tco_1369787 [Tanacetum coccineum]